MMMKKLILGLAAIASSLLCVAQQPDEVYIESNDDVRLEVITPADPTNETEQEVKEREKRLRELNDKTAFMKAENSLKRGYFVLLADNVQVGNMGYRHYDINSNSNFVLVQQDGGIVQVAFNTGNPGANGLGGITCRGKISNQRITTDKKGNVQMSYHLMGSNVSADVHITLYKGSSRAVAIINPTMRGPQITIYGNIQPYRNRNLKL